MISEIVPEGSKDILPILIPFRYEENQYPTGINAYPKKRLRVIKNIPLERSVQLIEKKMRLKIISCCFVKKKKHLIVTVIIYFIKLETDVISNRLKLSTKCRKIKF